MDGVVLDAMGGGQYQIEVRAPEHEAAGDAAPSQIVRAQLAGRLKKRHIRVLPGDPVTVAVSPYDLTHGIIVYRGKKTRPQRPQG